MKAGQEQDEQNKVFNAPGSEGEANQQTDTTQEKDISGNTEQPEGDEKDNKIFNPPGTEEKKDGEEGEEASESDGKELTEEMSKELDEYKLKFPEKMEVPEENQKEFKEFVKGLHGKSLNEIAQGLVDYEVERQNKFAQQQTIAVNQYRTSAEKQLADDPDFGGAKMKETYEDGKLYILNHARPGLKNALIQGGWIHPEIMAELAKVYQNFHKEPDGIVRGEPAASNKNIHPAYLKYPDIAKKQGKIK